MGMALVASDEEAEFDTLRGEARFFCAMQGGIKQWERGQALCIYIGWTFCMHAMKYTVWSSLSSHNSAVQSERPGRSNLHCSDYEPDIWFRASTMAICK